LRELFSRHQRCDRALEEPARGRAWPAAACRIAGCFDCGGVARSERRRDNAERLHIFLSGNIDVVPFDEQDAVTAGDLRAALEAAGTPIGSYDLLIAAQALRNRATLVTANISEFARVRSLVWQDWTRTG
jgi:predicted nucleic acid-binding protein